MSSVLAKRYAKALFDCALGDNALERVYADLVEIEKIISESKDFREFLKNPIFSIEERQTIIRSVLAESYNPLTKNFILFLAAKKRLNVFENICRSFTDLYRDANQILPVKITSRFELSSAQLKSLSSRLAEKFKKKIEPYLVVDAHLLGGLKVQIGDVVYDYSMRTQLEKFKENLVFA